MSAEAEEKPVAAVATAPAKADPETLALRAQPARPIRFKRGAVVALAALASICLVTTAWVALRSSGSRAEGDREDQAVAAKVPTEALDRLPGDYGEVPKLGPPLPGDLGRPILAHQRATAAEPPTPGSGRADEAAAAEREQRAAELKAARESAILAKAGGHPASGAEVAMRAVAPPAAPAEPTRPSPDAERDPNGQQRKMDFLAARDPGSDVDDHRLVAASPNMLSAGSVIAASLITGLRSDLPGIVTAQVTERVFDSATGTILLIPQGSRLIGRYDSVVAFGQKRALIAWQRIILPDGSSMRLDNVPAADPSGYSGLADKVDFHTWTLLKGVAISTLLGVGSNLTFSGESDLVRALREATQQNASRAGDQITSRNLQIQPTITIRPGAPVRLVVHRDLILAPWRG